MIPKTKRLVLLSGPSCVGKGPLVKAIDRYYKRDNGGQNLLTADPVSFGKVEVVKSFASRDGMDESLPRPEKEKLLRKDDDPKYFEDSATIEGWKSMKDQYIFGYCRQRPQAISLQHLLDAFERHDTVLIEAYYTIGIQALEHPVVRAITGLAVTTVFLSPLSVGEIRQLERTGEDMKKYLTYLMMRKMLVREKAMGKKLTEKILLEDLGRAEDAHNELSSAHLFSIFMWNHDGEGSENWHLKQDVKPPFFLRQPEEDAATCARSLAMILEGDPMKMLLPHCTRHVDPLFV